MKIAYEALLHGQTVVEFLIVNKNYHSDSNLFNIQNGIMRAYIENIKDDNDDATKMTGKDDSFNSWKKILKAEGSFGIVEELNED